MNTVDSDISGHNNDDDDDLCIMDSPSWTGHNSPYDLLIAKKLGIDCVVLKWKMRARLGPDQKFRIHYWSNEKDRRTCETDTTEHYLGSLNIATHYFAYVIVVNDDVVWSPPSNVLEFATDYIVIELTRHFNETPSMVNVQWSLKCNGNDIVLDGRNLFRLYYWSNETDKTYIDTHCQTLVINGLKCDKMYSAYVAVVDGDDIIPRVSNIVQFQTEPVMPSNIKATHYEGSAHDHLLVTFDGKQGENLMHEITLTPALHGEGAMPDISLKTRKTKAVFGKLVCGSMYEVTVRTIKTTSDGCLYSRYASCDHVALLHFHGPTNIHKTIDYINGKANVKIHFESLTQQDIARYHVRLSGEDDSIQMSVEENFAIFSNVAFGSSYTPSVVAETVEGSKSKRSYGTTFWTKPGKVESVTTNAESKSVEKVHWKSLRGAQSYIVRYGCDATDAIDEETQDCEFLIPNLPTSKTFFVQIVATNNGGIGTPSDRKFFNTALSPPSDLKLDDKSDSNRLRLMAHWHPCEHATAYKVNIINARTGASISGTVVHEAWHAFVDLEHGSEYYCRLQAIADSELRSSGFVASETVWTRPPRVTDLKASCESLLSCLITWKSVPHSTYIVRVQKEGDHLHAIPTKINEYRFNDIQCNSTYIVSVTAINQSGESEESDKRQFETAPNIPSNIKVARFEGSPHDHLLMTFDGDRAEDVRHEITLTPVHHNAIPYKIWKTKKSKVVIDMLEPGNMYDVTVRTIKTRPGGDLCSGYALCDRPALLCPDTPKLNVAVIKPAEMTISWRDLDIPPTKYVVQWTENGSRHESFVEATRFVIQNLLCCATYTYRVAAVNNAGRGPFTNVVTKYTGPPPLRNVTLMRNPQLPTTSFIVRFQDPDSTPKMYKLVAKNPDSETTITSVSERDEITLHGLNPGCPYEVFVISIYGTLESTPVECARVQS